MTGHLYLGNSTEPACFGHEEGTPGILTGGLQDLQQPIVIPKAFLDAFTDEDLQP